MMISRPAATGLVLMVLAFCSGCGTSEPGTLVRGKVTYKGTAVPMGVVNFFSEEGGRPIGATLESEGEYTVRVPAGNYTVVVLTSTPPVPPGWKEGDPIPKPPVEVPAKYRLPQNSPLKVVVPDQKSLDHDLPLE
jgi:hypothetical protein